MSPLRRLPVAARRALPWAGAALGAWAWSALTAQPLLERPLRVFGALLALRAAALWFRPAARLRLWRAPTAPFWLLPTAVVAACALVVPTAMLGFTTLAGWDFPLHVFHTHVLADLLPSLRGWTGAINAGWPEGDDYSLVAYLPAALLHRLSFRALDIELLVALQVAVVTAALPVVAALYLGRGLSAWAAFAGALLILVDPGLFHQGGLTPLMVAGLWPVRLSMTLCLGAMWAADVLVDGPTPRRLVVFMVLVAAAANSHVAGITYVAAALTLWGVARAASSGTTRAWWWMAPATLSALLTAGWLVLPFYETRDFQAKLGEGLELLRGFPEHLFALDYFDRVSNLEKALGLAGVVLLWRRNHRTGVLAAVCVLLGALWLSQDLLTALAPQKHKELVGKIQWARYDFFPRVLLMFAAGVAVAELLRWAVRALVARRTDARSFAFAAASVSLAWTAVLSAEPGLYGKSFLKRSHETPTVDGLPYAAGLRQASAWLAEHATPPMLVVVDTPLDLRRPTAHLGGLVAVWSGVPVAAVHRQGTFVFAVPGEADGAQTFTELHAGGATHWLSVGPPNAGAPPMTPLATFPGDVRLHELPRDPGDPRVHGPATVQHFGDDAIVLSGPTTGWEAGVRMRWHPRWQVTEGAGVVLGRGPLAPGARPVFLQVRVPPGVVRVVLQPGPPPSSGRGIAWTLLGLAGAVATAWTARRRAR